MLSDKVLVEAKKSIAFTSSLQKFKNGFKSTAYIELSGKNVFNSHLQPMLEKSIFASNALVIFFYRSPLLAQVL